MKLSLTIAVAGLLWHLPLLAQSPTPEQKKVTLDWIQSLQKENGGFAADSRPATQASLEATTQAIRALKYFGGQAIKPDACEKFVTRCYVKGMTGFAGAPGGKADVRATAMGLMAAADLKLPATQYVVEPVIFLCTSAKSFDEIRLAAAAYEAVQTKCELAKDWSETIRKMENKDGTYGTESGRARATAEAVVALVRLGGHIEKQDNVLRALKVGQRPDGGWARTGDKSDLQSTYLVLRAFVMLKGQPNVQAVRRFVGECRNPDGSYGLMPGEPGMMSATYYAGIGLHWLSEMK
jgi:prenyltransferase beta subunit